MYSSHRRPKKSESIQKKSLADPRETHTITRSADKYDLVPQAAPAATLVWLHGLGGNPLSFVPYFTDPETSFSSLKVVLPIAPLMPVTVNSGQEMNSWYDVPYTWDTSVNSTALYSADRLCAILAEEANATTNLFIGGLSQGGAMALFTGYSHYRGQLSGIIALSCYTFDMDVPQTRKNIPGLIFHGDWDETIDVAFSKSTYDRTLTDVNFTYQVIPGLEHWVSKEEMLTVREWIQTIARH